MERSFPPRTLGNGGHIRVIVPECHPACCFCGEAPNTVVFAPMTLPEPSLQAMRGPLAAALDALSESYALREHHSAAREASTPPQLALGG